MTEVSRASTGGSRTVVLLRVVDKGSEELGTVSLRRRWLSGILEDEQRSYPDEGAEKSEPAEGKQTWSRDTAWPIHGGWRPGYSCGKAGWREEADHVHVY